MGPISAFPMTPAAPAITVAAAGDAARDLKRAKSSSGRAYATSRADEERLKRRSNRMAKEFEGAMEKSVKRKLNSMSGSQNNRKLGLKVAQFIPGKGLEVAGAQVENDPAIYCSLGLKGDKHVDPLEETFGTIKGRQVSMDFAFKLINDNSKLLDHDKETRVTVMNCFRHVNPDSFNRNKTGWHRDVSSSTAYVRSITVTAPGEYSASQGIPEVFVHIGGGASGNATATVNLQSSASPGLYEVESITVTDGGAGYTIPPFLSFSTGTYTSELVAASAQANIVFLDDDKADANVNWHSTLGPDASLIRCGTHGKSTTNQVVAGTWRATNTSSGHIFGTLDPDTASAANTLISPFRYPRDMEIMYSRVNRQLLENYGWMLNPYKFTSFSRNASAEGITNDGTPQRTTLELWSNPQATSLDFNQTGWEENKKWSFPANVNNKIGTNVTDPKGFDWHSQFGPGKLSYQFSNDGTNPVCIDICVVGIKKDTPVSVDIMKAICNYNYAIHKFANIGDTNLNGFQCANPANLDLDLGSEEWHKNAKLPFMPDVCFKNPQSYLHAIPDMPGSMGSNVVDVYQQLNQGKKNPFKVVKRDQFIVSSGSSRAWNTTLPSIKYRPQLYENVEYPAEFTVDHPTDDIVSTADEYTFVLCIGASGLPKPVEEVYTANKPYNNNGAEAIGPVDMKAIIDRQPSTCNVSVVGTYKETVYPCFPKDASSVNFVNGRLTEPYFETAPGLLVPNSHEPLAPRVNTVDISQLGQVVHTTATGVVGVGAINTDVGA